MFINYKNGKINVDIKHNQKAFICYVLIEFKTTEKQSLNEILRKFKYDKFNSIGTNLNNKTQLIKTSLNNVFVVLPESKCLSFIQTLYRYILNSDISGFTINNFISSEQSFNKLHNDIKKGFDLTITGKCKILENKIKTNHKQIKNFSTILGTTAAKNRQNIKPGSKADERYLKFNFSGNYDTKLYFSIICQSFDFYFSNNDIYINKFDVDELNNYLKENKKIFQGFVKMFLSQCGSLSTKPSSNDKGGTKMKKRNETTLENINIIIKIISGFYNLDYKKITNLNINFDALNNVKKTYF